LSQKNRLDIELAHQNLVKTRSQAESYIKLGKVKVDGKTITKPGFFVSSTAVITLLQQEQYVGRAGLKLASIAQNFGLIFTSKTVLDVGSSTGGFTDYSLKRGARAVIAVDVGTGQLHPSLRTNPNIELHEKTDIRDFTPRTTPDIILIDISFISLREVLPHIHHIAGKNTHIVAMVKPQFEAGKSLQSKGVIKNDSIRRQVLKDFELWVKKQFVIINKSDSEVAGQKGNIERFYLLKITINTLK
jgi:23S rRNA (cytidine1920-2'-O)/16S rRNA (cytidine1409-2'-O)-methyltransferase